MSYGLYAKDNRKEIFSSEMDGSILFFDDKILLENTHSEINGEYNYNIIKKDNIDFIEFANKSFLLLKSTDFLILYNKDYLYEGLRIINHRSGRHMNFIGQADKYSASSFLIEGNKKYEAKNLSYIGLDNPWAEGVSGSGIGEYLDIEWRTEKSTLVIINGFISYDKPELFGKNNRVKRIKVTSDVCNEGIICELQDSPNPQIINLGFSAKKIRLEIVDIYKGSQWDDTCLELIYGISSEIGPVLFE
jgi:hypothetical protein